MTQRIIHKVVKGIVIIVVAMFIAVMAYVVALVLGHGSPEPLALPSSEWIMDDPSENKHCVKVRVDPELYLCSTN
jgi:hypothetical protein